MSGFLTEQNCPRLEASPGRGKHSYVVSVLTRYWGVIAACPRSGTCKGLVAEKARCTD